MAKVALIATSWTPEVEEYSNQLMRHNQDVVFITDQNAKVSESYQGLVLRPFKKWNTTEALKLSLSVFNDPIDVWHFFIDDQFASVGFRSFLTLMSLHQVKLSSIVCLSVASSHSQTSKLRLKWLLKFCDLVTFQTREDLMFFKRNQFVPPSVACEVWSPTQLLKISSDALDTDIDLERLIAARKPYFILPSVRSFLALQGKLEQSSWSFFVLERAPTKAYHDNSSFVFLDSVTAAEKSKLTAESSGWIVNFEDLSNLELLNVKSVCNQTKIPILCNRFQVELTPGLVRHKSTGLIAESLNEDLSRLLQDLHRICSTFDLEEAESASFPDTIMNEILRLYGNTKLRKRQQRENLAL